MELQLLAGIPKYCGFNVSDVSENQVEWESDLGSSSYFLKLNVDAAIKTWLYHMGVVQ